jgi:hypothetical protein
VFNSPMVPRVSLSSPRTDSELCSYPRGAPIKNTLSVRTRETRIEQLNGLTLNLILESFINAVCREIKTLLKIRSRWRECEIICIGKCSSPRKILWTKSVKKNYVWCLMYFLWKPQVSRDNFNKKFWEELIAYFTLTTNLICGTTIWEAAMLVLLMRSSCVRRWDGFMFQVS